MRVLVIAPHPDDEVLGVGGTIANHAKRGDDVYLCIVTRAYPPDRSEEFIKNRPNEVKKVNDILGIKKTFFLDFPTTKLDTIPQRDMNDSIDKIVNEVKPDIVYLPHHGDLNKDHRIVFEASLVALRPIKHKVKRILSYETLSETEWGLEPFLINTYSDISETFEKKMEAMKAYETELMEYPHPRSLESIESHARKRGSEIGVKFAECFVLIREIVE